MAESEEELKNLLMKVKEESERAGLKLNIQKTNIIASGPIISWQIEGEKVEAVTDFIFLDSKIIIDSDCSHEIKMLASLKKSYDKPRQCIKKPEASVCQQKSIYSKLWFFQYSCMDHKEGWASKNLDCKEIKPVNPKGNQPGNRVEY